MAKSIMIAIVGSVGGSIFLQDIGLGFDAHRSMILGSRLAVPPAGFEPAHPAPEAGALSPELRGRGPLNKGPDVQMVSTAAAAS